MILVTDPCTLNVAAGRFRLSAGPDDVLVAHPECGVAVCAHEPELRIGGMIHFLLPDRGPGVSRDRSSLQDMINAILRRGADRRRLGIWLFGGADAPNDVTGFGTANAEFVRSFMETSGFLLRGTDLGGNARRQIRFHPHSGQVEVSVLAPLVQEPLPNHTAAPG